MTSTQTEKTGTARNWYLYNDMPEASVVSLVLDMATDRALADITNAIREFQAIAEVHGHVGAADTEPRYTFASAVFQRLHDLLD